MIRIHCLFPENNKHKEHAYIKKTGSPANGPHGIERGNIIHCIVLKYNMLRNVYLREKNIKLYKKIAGCYFHRFILSPS